LYIILLCSFYSTIWKLVRKIKNGINAGRPKLVIDALGEPKKSKIKSGHNKTSNIHLKELVKRQNEDSLTIGELLTTVSNNIRKRID